MVRSGEADLLPPWLNYTIHLYILLLPAVEFFFLPRPRFSARNAMLSMAGIGLAYLGLLEFLMNVYEITPYPFYQLMSTSSRFLLNLFFIAGVAPVCCLLTWSFRAAVHLLKEQSKEKFN